MKKLNIKYRDFGILFGNMNYMGISNDEYHSTGLSSRGGTNKYDVVHLEKNINKEKIQIPVGKMSDEEVIAEFKKYGFDINFEKIIIDTFEKFKKYLLHFNYHYNPNDSLFCIVTRRDICEKDYSSYVSSSPKDLEKKHHVEFKIEL